MPMFAPAVGTLLNVQTFSTSGIYNKTPGQRFIIVKIGGAGGGSGGTVTTASASQNSASGGGASGTYAEVLLTGGLSGQTVTIGAGGPAGVAGSNGGNGGSSSFGSLIICPGGGGGQVGNNIGNPGVSGVQGSPGASATITTGQILFSEIGQSGEPGIVYAINAIVLGGQGGSTLMGVGGLPSGGGPGNSPSVCGGANGGIIVGNTAGAPGAVGGNGYCVIYEYS